MNRELVYQFLVMVLDCQVYSDFVPEDPNMSYPVAAYFKVSDSSERFLNYSVALRRNTFQIQITAKGSRTDTDILVNKLLAFDGLSTDSFQLISVISNSDEPSDGSFTDLFTTNLELEFIERS